jgi:hypothetical protein
MSPESDHSWTEEICLNALAYLDSGSDEENCFKQKRFSDSIKKENRPSFSTQDESSFLSAVDSEKHVFEEFSSTLAPIPVFNFVPEMNQSIAFKPTSVFLAQAAN